jgi:uncharacterized membrane protein YphA (DoxX/SURF4 family)
MKLITSVSRVLVGLLFMFSGLIKSNDPKGTAIKLNEYFEVFAKDFEKPMDSVFIQLKDNYGTDTTFAYQLNEGDTVKSIQVNQSSVREAAYDNEEGGRDTFTGSQLYLAYDNAKLYDEFYVLDDTSGLPHVSVNVRTASGKVLMDKKLDLTLSSKYEVRKDIDVSAYVVEQSGLVGFFKWLKNFSIYFSIIMCVLEVALGFAILIGWQARIMAWLILLLILFFTFLTGYSAYFNKVTDCGCFGDFIKLTPWTSFSKDLILLVFILVIFFRRKHIVPLFSPLFGLNAVLVVTIASSVFSIYCNTFLPAWDFLPYKAGNNIREMMTPPKGARLVAEYRTVLVYEKNGKRDSFTLENYPKDGSWKFITSVNTLINPAWKSEVHGFEIFTRDDNNEHITDSLLNGKGYYILIVSTHFEEAHKNSWQYIKTLAEEAKKEGVRVYGVTASPLNDADTFTAGKQLPFRFNNADETLLKTIVRSNPGVMLWHDGTIIDKWSCRSIPAMQKIRKLMNKK